MGRRTLSLVLAGLISIVCLGAPAVTPKTVGFEAYEIIGRQNVFSSQRGLPPAQEPPAPEAPVPDLGMRVSINVVGIVKTASSETTFAIIEENGRHRMCRIGETVCGMLILDIDAEEVIFEDPGGPWGKRIQPPVPGGGIPAPRLAPAPVETVVARGDASTLSGRRLPIRAASVPTVVRRIGLVTDVRDGATRGLRLTEDFMGLREGDCITFVGSQSLRTEHPRQKLWQIARKYGACHGPLPDIPVVVERDNREMEFVLHPFS